MGKFKQLASIIGILVYSNAFGQAGNASFQHLYQLLEQKDCFKAKQQFESLSADLSKPQQEYVAAVLDNAFNQLNESQQAVNALTSGKPELPDSLLYKLYELKTDNSLKLYDYKGAKIAIVQILKDYQAFLTPSEVDDYKNSLKLWAALEEVPAQQVDIREYTNMKMVKDRIGLRNLSLVVHDTTVHFIFDTGANISTTTRSMAQRLKMQVIPADIEVNTITGKKVMADLGVCDLIQLGNIDIRNAVFLVMPDEVLNIPQVDFQINGILGYPVIAAMKEITITKAGEFEVPIRPSMFPGPSNLAMDGLTPMICISERPYTFDTGADETILYRAFYLENKADIDKRYKLQKIKFGGAGGISEFDGFVIQHKFRILGKKVKLKRIQLLKEKVKEAETVYGNIGQDLIRHFDAMTLNFEGMFIRFE